MGAAETAAARIAIRALSGKGKLDRATVLGAVQTTISTHQHFSGLAADWITDQIMSATGGRTDQLTRAAESLRHPPLGGGAWNPYRH